jgi:hypothetical protein
MFESCRAHRALLQGGAMGPALSMKSYFVILSK